MFNVSKFGERLKELSDDRGLTAAGLSKELSCNRSNITRYMSGERAPQFALFVKIVEYFNCSADYLLGKSDYPPDTVNFLPVPKFLGKRLRYVMNFCGFSQYKLAKNDNFSGSVIYSWLSDKKQPTAESLYNLAETMGCTVDFLLGRVN